MYQTIMRILMKCNDMRRGGLLAILIAGVGSAGCMEVDLHEESDMQLDTSEQELTQSQHLAYRAHLQSLGWRAWVYDPAMVGTVGQSRRLEAIEIITSSISNFGVCYQARVAGYGWQLPACNGGTAGTTGESRRMEELAIWLSPNTATDCRIQYRVHVAFQGWLTWVSEGVSAGCPGCRIEAVEIRFENRACN
jgi:uncharacterized protein YjdB